MSWGAVKMLAPTAAARRPAETPARRQAREKLGWVVLSLAARTQEPSDDRGYEQEWHHRDGEEAYPDEHDGSYAVSSTSHCSPPTSKLERLYPQRLNRTGR